MRKKTIKIRSLFLDVGGVLLTNGWDHEARELAISKFHLDADEIHERHYLTFDTYEEGKLSLDDYLKRVVFHQKRQFTPQDFKEFMFSQSQPFMQMINLVKELKSKYQLRTIIVNNEGKELNSYRINHFRLDDFVDAFVSSCIIHIRKPDEDIFRAALDISQTPPEQVIYLDDRPMFIEVAQGLGINGICHQSPEKTGEALKQYGLVPSGLSRKAEISKG